MIARFRLAKHIALGFVLLTIAAPLAGCGADTHIVTQVQPVDRPVAISCVPKDMPSAPAAYPDADSALKAAPDAAERYLLLYAGHKLRQARGDLVESVLAGCR